MHFRPRRIFTYFLQGLVYLAPVGLTLYVVWSVFTGLDGMLTPLVRDLVPFQVPGIGIVVVFLGISFMGYFITRFISARVLLFVDGLLKRAPGIKVVYTAVNDLITVFFAKKEGMGRAVRVVVQRDPLQYKIGFITQDDLEAFGFSDADGIVSVYFPYSYGIMGNQMFVRRSDVEMLDIPASQAMKFIVSGGVTRLEDHEHEEGTHQPN